jgi:xylose isomerase
VCIRFPAAEFRLGAFTNPQPGVRQRAVELASAGCAWAAQLGASELVVWPQYDGYDYNFQVRFTRVHADMITCTCVCGWHLWGVCRRGCSGTMMRT